VGEALAAYLVAGRPRCAAATVFYIVRAPYRRLPSAAVRAIMGHACQRAGAHRLRHWLATEMLRAGASLPEVGQVLRHRSQLATSVYAKVDDHALRVLARPWPGGAL
jgi:integrase/recombinase XerD